MKTWIKSLKWTLGLLASLTMPALAVTYPYHAKGEQNIDTHQVGYGDVLLTADGIMKVHSKFSNGKRIAGNNFYAVTSMHNAAGGVIGYFVQWKGLNGSGGGRAVEGDVNDSFKLNATQLAQFDHVSFRFGAKNCGIRITGLHLEEGSPKNGVTLGEVECGNVPK
ncbi:hypothetical protein ACCS54_18915 [Rhizobium johnstonii]|uniref:hypothetical protein n=1 Tax=Rhizobium johnstonii TaxID=3019933 RepID=UPI003F993851